MLLDPAVELNCYFVWAVSVTSIAMTWQLLPFLPAFRFSRNNDVGITIYLSLVSIWFLLGLPPSLLAPLFFADPAAAIVGKTLTWSPLAFLNPSWYGSKTVVGTLTVFAVTYYTISYDCSEHVRLAIAALAAVGEAIGGDYDNAVIGAVVIGGWFVTK
jgi:hypothetical protein